jgi:hypothetical protein
MCGSTQKSDAFFSPKRTQQATSQHGLEGYFESVAPQRMCLADTSCYLLGICTGEAFG